MHDGTSVLSCGRYATPAQDDAIMVTAEIGDLRTGRALDRGLRPRVRHALARWARMAGHRGRLRHPALAYARSTAEGMGPDVVERIDWVEADLATWTPPRDEYDLVVCLYVHVAGSVEEMVRRMATGVARGGTLFLVGHRPIDPATGAATAAAGQVQVSVEAALAALDGQWQPIVARASADGRFRRRCRDPSPTALLTTDKLGSEADQDHRRAQTSRRSEPPAPAPWSMPATRSRTARSGGAA